MGSPRAVRRSLGQSSTVRSKSRVALGYLEHSSEVSGRHEQSRVVGPVLASPVYPWLVRAVLDCLAAL